MWGAPQGRNEHKKAFPALGILAFISKSHFFFFKKKFEVKESQGKGPTRLMQPLVPEHPTQRFLRQGFRGLAGIRTTPCGGAAGQASVSFAARPGGVGETAR